MLFLHLDSSLALHLSHDSFKPAVASANVIVFTSHSFFPINVNIFFTLVFFHFLSPLYLHHATIFPQHNISYLIFRSCFDKFLCPLECPRAFSSASTVILSTNVTISENSLRSNSPLPFSNFLFSSSSLLRILCFVKVISSTSLYFFIACGFDEFIILFTIEFLGFM